MLEDKILSRSMLKRLCLFATAVPLIAAIISSCFISPVYVQTSSDILYSGSPIPDILGYTISLLDVIFASAQYAAIILSFLFFSEKSNRRAVRLISVGAIVTYRALNQAVQSITDGTDFSSGITVALLYAALEVVELYVCVFISAYLCQEAVKRFSLLRTASRRLGNPEFNWTYEVYPYHLAIKKSHPVQMSALLIAVVFGTLRVLSRIIYDLSLGAPESTSEILQMVAGYFSDIVCGVLIYIFILLFCACFFRMLKKPTAKFIKNDQ